MGARQVSLRALPSAVDLGLAFVSAVFNHLQVLPYIVSVTISSRVIAPHSITLVGILTRDFVPNDARRYALHVNLLQHRALVVLGLASFGRRWVGAVHACIAIESCGD